MRPLKAKGCGKKIFDAERKTKKEAEYFFKIQLPPIGRGLKNSGL